MKNLALENSKIISADVIDSKTFTAVDGAVYENLPRFCRVIIESSYGGGSHVMTEVWLPDDWNGILIGLGNGGMAGYIDYGGLSEQIRNGYGAVNCDMGTARGEESGINNPDVWMDFGWRGTHNMTVMAKVIMEKYYGKKPDFSYFLGGSTGGEQAFSLAQRSPADYDGILARVPANNRIFLHTYFLWNYIHLNDNDGNPLFTEEEVTSITDLATRYFQKLGDGEKGDNFITHPYQDENTVDSFIEFLGDGFTNEQLEALRAVYNGPVNQKTGKQIYNGMPIGSEIYGCGINDCMREPQHYYPFIWAFGEGYNPRNFDFADDMDTINERMSPHMNANDADLSAFFANGGKLISFSGSADPCVPFPDAMNYYNRVCKKLGSFDKVKDFFRYYMIPGLDHGGGGRGANKVLGEGGLSHLDILRRWREEGVAPNHLLAVREEDEKTIFSREIKCYKADKIAGKDFPKTCEYVD